MFLTPDEVAILTGCKWKSYQCNQLRKMGIPFFVNANGHPVVARSAIEGRSESAQNIQLPWTPKPLRA